MSRVSLSTKDERQSMTELLYKDIERRVAASSSDVCPVDLTYSILKLCSSQSCGKCTPCRVGLVKLADMFGYLMRNEAREGTIEKIRVLSENIANTADCAIGIESAKLVLRSLDAYENDINSHMHEHKCTAGTSEAIPCVSNCPANVDIPGYIALVNDKQYENAVALVRKTNPFASACAYVCEHPCETRCRRTILDAPLNIRGLKRAAVDFAKNEVKPTKAEPTGKKVAIIGAGPAGLSAAYFLQLMGHECTVFEQHKKLGGMLLYGIPAYRLPRKTLQKDLDAILDTGVKVETGVKIGEGDKSIEELRKQFDAVFISIGAHLDKKANIEGEDAKGVYSAVEFLGKIGDDEIPDFKGKTVCVIGGGNVAMDCVRSAIRCGAEKANIIYRRRRDDMTALPEEIDGAIAEGAELLELMNPVKINKNSAGEVESVELAPMMSSIIKNGKMDTESNGESNVTVKCDVVLIAVGQGIEFKSLESGGVPVERGGTIKAGALTSVEGVEGVFAGGDCVTGPKSAIRAIAAGKIAAANIDEYLGFNHQIVNDIEIPEPRDLDKVYRGRVNMKEREASDRKNDFELMEHSMNEKEACLESSRCLRCDKFGCGSFRGGRQRVW